MSYAELLQELRYPKPLVSIAAGEILPPIESCRAPFDQRFGFPPVLLPVWTDLSKPAHIGVWRHWFCDRKPSFTLVSIEGGMRPQEIARSFEQLVQTIAIWSIVENDGVEREVERFARSVGLSNLEILDQLTLASGDDPTGFLSLPAFEVDPPAWSLDDETGEYLGDFPVGDATDLDLEQVCSLELAPAQVEQIRDLGREKLPPWLSGRDQKEVFESLLKERDVRGAWMCLNSSGWQFEEAIEGIRRLGFLAEDESFTSLAREWASNVRGLSGGY